ncbi:MAG TPA: lytic transglycosylase domain-containing protein [Longimicrobiaceae bacterium]|nr:lytic transglycosylase domain-containing protein [Longimicrobiaceae bacterium]
MSTAALNVGSMASGGVLRRPALWALFALCAWVSPATGQQGDSTRLPAPETPQLGEHAPFGREFWARLREEARRFRELEIGSFVYARQYAISDELARMIHEEARAQGIDPELAFRLVRVESRFHPRARSHAGALGLTQLMPGTARGLDRRMRTAEAIMEPRANLRVGFRYLRGLIDRYDGDVRLALLAYNRGEGAVDRSLRRGRDPENGYSRKVLGTGRNAYRGTGLVQQRPSD